MKAKAKAKLCIDAGCGNNCQPGFVGMDKRALKGVDVVHDIEDIPWPFETESAEVIKMTHVLEHIKPWLILDLFAECHRILKLDGKLLISMPYGVSYRFVQDPTHCNPMNEASFAYFDPKEPLYQVYKPPPWTVEMCYWMVTGDIEVCMSKIEMKMEVPNG